MKGIAIHNIKTQIPVSGKNKKRLLRLLRNSLKNYQLYMLLLPALVYIIIFHYGAMYGLQIAFKDYFVTKGIAGSPWVGFIHFRRFFKSTQFLVVIKNTVFLSLYGLLVGFPIPILLALSINNVQNKFFKSLVQTVTYAPHFISTVVIVSMMFIFLSPRSGFVNIIRQSFGGTPVHFIAKPEWFKSLYVFSDIWQSSGWSAIIYIAALSNISIELHEAAIIDGANKFQRIKYIDIPGIMPTVITLLIINIGNIMSVGFEKTFLMQNSLNIMSSEIIQTYVYKIGLVSADFSYSAAIGLFNSAINFFLLLGTNRLSKKLTDISLW